MVLYQVYSQKDCVCYRAHALSTATLFQAISLLFTFLPPLFIGYFTSGYYYKELTYREQPQVTFLQNYFLFIDSTSGSLFTSSYTLLNENFQSVYASSNIDFEFPEDVDNDGIVDQYQIILTLPLPSTTTVAGSILNLGLIFHYSLSTYEKIDMEAMGIISVNVPSLLLTQNNLTVYGDLRFYQSQPIQSYGSDSSLNGSIIDYGSYSIVPSFEDIFVNYTSRNYYTTFTQHYTKWSLSSAGSTTSLTIKVVLNTNLQLIRYVPSFWQEFRWAWIQYISILLPFLYVMNKIKEFVFSNHLVRTLATPTIMKKML